MAKLRLSEWASIAEVIGAIGVVISLVYVGVQVSENTAEIRAANRQSLALRSHTATIDFARSPELAAVFAKAASNKTLTLTEQWQYGYFVRAVLYDVQEAFLLHREGRLENEYWDTRSALLRVYLASDTAIGIYEDIKSKGLLHVDFVDWVDEHVWQ